MVACIIIVGLALLWLGFESHWLTIKLAYGKPLQSYSMGLKPQSNIVALTENTTQENDTTERNPVIFTALDMPDTQGTLTIICKRS
jgi:hypothetical protein